MPTIMVKKTRKPFKNDIKQYSFFKSCYSLDHSTIVNQKHNMILESYKQDWVQRDGYKKQTIIEEKNPKQLKFHFTFHIKINILPPFLLQFWDQVVVNWPLPKMEERNTIGNTWKWNVKNGTMMVVASLDLGYCSLHTYNLQPKHFHFHELKNKTMPII